MGPRIPGDFPENECPQPHSSAGRQEGGYAFAGRAGGWRTALLRLAAGSTPRRNPLQESPPAASRPGIACTPLTSRSVGPEPVRASKDQRAGSDGPAVEPSPEARGMRLAPAPAGAGRPRGGGAASPPVRPGPAAAVACAPPRSPSHAPSPGRPCLPQRGSGGGGFRPSPLSPAGNEEGAAVLEGTG